MRALREKAFAMLTSLRSMKVRSFIFLPGATSIPRCWSSLWEAATLLPWLTNPGPGQRQVVEVDVLRHRQLVHELVVLVDRLDTHLYGARRDRGQ